MAGAPSSPKARTENPPPATAADHDGDHDAPTGSTGSTAPNATANDHDGNHDASAAPTDDHDGAHEYSKEKTLVKLLPHQPHWEQTHFV